MAVYFAYYDASGTEKKTGEPLVVAGLLAREDKWLKLEREWTALLARVPLDRVHMTDLGHGKGQYAPLRADPKRELRFLSEMVDIMLQRIDRCFVMRLIPDEMHTVNEEYKLLEYFGSAYSLTAQACRTQVDNWMAKVRPGCRVHHIFEQGDHRQGDFMQFQAREANPASFKPAKDPTTGEWFVPFQVADVFVHEHWLDVKRRLANNERDRRAVLLAMRRGFGRRIEPMMLDVETLTKVCVDHPQAIGKRVA